MSGANQSAFKNGFRDGIPIAAGYFAVSFALGIAMRNAGFSVLQGAVTSLLNLASAGEYAGISLIAQNASFTAVALMTLIVNARYFLMSCALSQKISPETPLYHRFLISYSVTDELFAVAAGQLGWLNPFYYYGAMSISVPAWTLGTAFGVALGSILPPRLVASFSAALYGMFLAIVIPKAKQEKPVLFFTALAFCFSFLGGRLPHISQISEGTRTMILTVLLSSLAALLFPREEEE